MLATVFSFFAFLLSRFFGKQLYSSRMAFPAWIFADPARSDRAGQT
jgi:hypothetical protein